MTLFSIQNQGCGSGGSSGTGKDSFDYFYALRFNVNNTMFLRAGNGFGDFSNNNPDVIPCDSILEKLVVSNENNEFDTFTIDVFRNGLLVYSLTKPMGNQSIIQKGGMPAFVENDLLSVRISGMNQPITNPRVHAYLKEA